jgi:hypothetical protein
MSQNLPLPVESISTILRIPHLASTSQSPPQSPRSSRMRPALAVLLLVVAGCVPCQPYCCPPPCVYGPCPPMGGPYVIRPYYAPCGPVYAPAYSPCEPCAQPVPDGHGYCGSGSQSTSFQLARHTSASIPANDIKPDPTAISSDLLFESLRIGLANIGHGIDQTNFPPTRSADHVRITTTPEQNGTVYHQIEGTIERNRTVTFQISSYDNRPNTEAPSNAPDELLRRLRVAWVEIGRQR